MLGEPGWCYAVFLSAVDGIALCLPPRSAPAFITQPPKRSLRESAPAHGLAAYPATPALSGEAYSSATSSHGGDGSCQEAAVDIGCSQEAAHEPEASQAADPLAARSSGSSGVGRRQVALEESTAEEGWAGLGGANAPAQAHGRIRDRAVGQVLELREGTAKLGGADAPAEVAVADALQRWRMLDDSGRGRGAVLSEPAGAGGSGGLRVAERGPSVTDGCEGQSAADSELTGVHDSRDRNLNDGVPQDVGGSADPAASLRSDQGAGRASRGSPATVTGQPLAAQQAAVGVGGGRGPGMGQSVQLFAGFVSYETLEAVVLGGPGGRPRRDVGATWVKMTGPGMGAIPGSTTPTQFCKTCVMASAHWSSQRGPALAQVKLQPARHM